MSDLHWTGAAILLSLALMGSEGLRPRRETSLRSLGFARERARHPQEASGATRRLAAAPVPSEEPRGGYRRRAS